ncbi:MAG TPA: SDR family NAD(P)-dependent oxidoreductase [Longimicrobiales bacterium]|nr:SDR family NAD(P)-dependent oxidoreductase [Longimicrobiales bacterium]
MTQLRGATAIVTGASRGIGPYLARALGGAGARLLLVARSAPALETLAAELRSTGTEAVSLPLDLMDPAAPEELLARTRDALGDVAVVVNNAGVELTRHYHELDRADVERVIWLNLTFPMLLTRAALPGMLERRTGHIVNIASLAGKAAPAFHETYSATKAGLIAFTRSLRASYPESGVGFSVVTPGFVREAGMHHRAKEASGVSTPPLVGTVSPQAVADAMMRALRTGTPEIMVVPLAARLMEAALHPFPAAAERVVGWLGVTEMYRRIAAGRARSEGAE